MPPPILQSHMLCSGYGALDVLHDICFELQRGEVLGVVGPNGCGKSTLLRSITGLLPIRSGSVVLDGIPLAQLSLRQQARLCAVQMQSEFPAFDFSVERFVMLARHPYLAALSRPSLRDHDVVAAALAHAEVSSLANRSIRSISSGEWQRVLLARALAQNTPILLLDEPAAHLDPGHRYAMHILLRKLARDKNLAVLCISHDLNLAAEFCDRLLVLHRGMTRAFGAPENILSESLLQDVFQCAALRLSQNPFTGRPGTVFAP